MGIPISKALVFLPGTLLATAEMRLLDSLSQIYEESSVQDPPILSEIAHLGESCHGGNETDSISR